MARRERVFQIVAVTILLLVTLLEARLAGERSEGTPPVQNLAQSFVDWTPQFRGDSVESP